MSYFYTDDSGEQKGPVEISVLKELLANKEIDLDSFVWTDGMDDWVELRNSPVGKTLRSTPPPPPMVKAQSVPLLGDVWIEDSDKLWIKSKILSANGTKLKIKNISGDMFEIEESGAFKANLLIVSDMSELAHIHEPGILSNLFERFISDKSFTSMASVLIYLNPMKLLPDLPLASNQQSDPNAFSFAENVLANLFSTKNSQSIIVSGLSGSGKSDCASKLWRYLASRDLSQPASFSDNKLLQSHLLLNNFGNAKTCKNKDSTRYGKCMKLNYHRDSQDRLSQACASVEVLMLEKTRVVRQFESESNFHIFYQLLAAIGSNAHFLPQELMEAVCEIGREYVADAANYLFLSGDVTLVTSNELAARAAACKDVCGALRLLGYNDVAISDVMKILLGILFLGNILFVDDEAASCQCAVDDSAVLDTAAYFLGLREDQLASVLMERGVQSASCARDMMAKGLYEGLFRSIVDSMNQKFEASNQRPSQPHGDSYVGVVDLYGFECLEDNQFEQLLINYANECLQGTFNSQIFETELRLYQSENISCSISAKALPSNSSCLDLVADKNSGILSILDSLCRQSVIGTDEQFCESVHKLSAINQNRNFVQVHPNEKTSSFCVRHYAGSVKYSAGNWTDGGDWTDVSMSWIVKNNDHCPDGLAALCQSASVQLLRTLLNYQEKDELAANAAAPAAKAGPRPPPRPVKPSFVKSTQSSRFCKSVKDLCFALEATDCHFVRCIKPNSTMQPNKFDMIYVADQVRSLGIVQTCQMLHSGMPNRIGYHDLRLQLPNIATMAEAVAQEESAIVAMLLQAVNFPSESYKLGNTMIFFKSGQLQALQLLFQRINSSRDQSAIISNLQIAIDQYQQIFSVLEDLENEFDMVLTASQQTHAYIQSIGSKFSSLISSSTVHVPDDVRGVMELVDTEQHNIDDMMSRCQSQMTACATKCSASEILLAAAGQKDTCKVMLQSALASHASCQQQHDKLVAMNMDNLQPLFKSLQQGATAKQFYDVLQQQKDSVASMDKLLDQCQTCMTAARDSSKRLHLPATEQTATQCQPMMNSIRQFITKIQSNIQRASAQLHIGEEGGFLDYSEVRRLAADVLRGAGTLQGTIDEITTTLGQLDKIISDSINAEAAASLDAQKKSAVRRVPPPLPNHAIKSPPPRGPPGPPPPPGSKSSRPPPLPVKAVAASEDDSVVVPPRVPPVPTKPPSTAPPKRPVKQTTDGEIQPDIAAANLDGSATTKPKRLVGLSETAQMLEKNLTFKTADEMEEEAPLPTGWKELVDKTSGRSYFVNKTTKERQWKRPVIVASHSSNADSESSDVSSSAVAPTKPAMRPPTKSAVKPAVSTGDSDTSAATTTTTTTTTKARKAPVVPKQPPRASRSAGSATTINNPTSKQAAKSAAEASSTGTDASVIVVPKVPAYAPPPVPAFPPPADGVSLPLTSALKPPAKNSKDFKIPKLPKNPPPIIETPQSEEDANDEVVKPVDRFSRRLTAADREQLQAQLVPSGSRPTSASSPVASAAPSRPLPDIPTSARASVTFSLPLTVKSKQDNLFGKAEPQLLKYRQHFESICDSLTVSGRPTMTQLEILGRERKSGYLMKQSSILKRWVKKFIVLDGSTMEYYDKGTDVGKPNKGGKVLELRGDSCSTYTSQENCFYVRVSSDDTVMATVGSAGSWFLMAQEESDVEEWMTAINAHIHVQCMFELGRNTDYWDMGNIGPRFYRVPSSSLGIKRLPVGIRTLPCVDGPRTGEGIYPGELVEICQVVSMDDNVFLRLADDRGWVFENHPDAGYALLIRVDGEIIEDNQTYECAPKPPSDDNDDGNEEIAICPVYMGPSLESEVLDLTITTGEVVDTCMTFTPDEMDDYEVPLTFLKLTNQRGWITLQDTESGEVMFN